MTDAGLQILNVKSGYHIKKENFLLTKTKMGWRLYEGGVSGEDIY